MKRHMYQMIIEAKINTSYLISLSSNTDSTYILFEPIHKRLVFLLDDAITEIFKNNEYQLRKILHNKRLDTFYTGFHLVFAFQIGKDVKAYNDRSKVIVIDRRNGMDKNYVTDHPRPGIIQLFTDASYDAINYRGGIAFIIEGSEGEYRLVTDEVEGDSSNQLELLAVIRGLQVLEGSVAIRIITDSQYVRKGLTEWLPCWMLNDWTTVNGEKVKNIDLWLKVESLLDGKYIELAWVKGHTNHFENTLCDLYAKDAVKSGK